MIAQPGLCGTWLETPKTGFLITRLIYSLFTVVYFDIFQDFIQLIDKLEGACIRFVHFSQENEVRSRVGSVVTSSKV